MAARSWIPSLRWPLIGAFFLLSLMTLLEPLYGQVSPDGSRPFELGRPVTLPGTGLYLGDLPHEVGLSPLEIRSGTLSGEMARSVGWRGPGFSPLGAAAAAPGLFFEGIAYPLDPSLPLNWLPVPAQAEFLGFPASAWWGPGAAARSVQLLATSSRNGRDLRALAWGGEGSRGGFSALFQEGTLFFGGQSRLVGQSGTRGMLSGRMAWVDAGDLRVDSGFHAAQGPVGDHWAAFFTGMELAIAPFQSVQARPYIQSAQEGTRKGREWGLETRYRLDLAGFAQAQVGGGFSTIWTDGILAEERSERGFVQAGLQGDLLGSVTGDLALRLDMGTTSNSLSFLLGAQILQGDLAWCGDLAKGPEGWAGLELLEGGAGLRFQPDEHFNLTAKLFHEEGKGGNFEGFKGGWHFKGEGPILGFPKRLGLLVQEKVLLDQAGALHWDTAFILEVAFFGPERLWVQGRSLSNGSLLQEAGLEWRVLDGWRAHLRASNLGGEPIAWPDLDSPMGLHFSGGMDVDL